MTINRFSFNQNILTILFTAVIVMVISGCAGVPNRLNHMHNEAYFEKAKLARGGFNAVRSERTGLSAKMLANLAAQKQLRETVAAESTEFFDLVNFQMVQDITWGDLRRELFWDLGWTKSRDLLFLLATMRQIEQDSTLATDAKEKFLKEGTMLANSFIGIREIEKRQQQPRDDLINDWFEAPLDVYFLAHDYKLTEEQILNVHNYDSSDIGKLVRAFEAEDAGKIIDPSLINYEQFGQRIETSADTNMHKQYGKQFLSPPAPERDEAVSQAVTRAIRQQVFAGAEESLTGQIKLRLNKLAAVLKVFEVLIKGERARIAILTSFQRKMLANATKELGLHAKEMNHAASESNADVTADTRLKLNITLDLISDLQKSISSYWREEGVREKYLVQANQLQRQLLLAAEKSRDPAAVLSLVPLAGEGLSPSDLGWLDDYIEHLDELVSDPNSKMAELNEAIDAEERMHSTNGASRQGADAAILGRVKEFQEAYDSLGSLLESATQDGLIDEQIDSIMKNIILAADELDLDLELASVAENAMKLSNLEQPLSDMLNQGELDSSHVTTLLSLIFGSKNLNTFEKPLNNVLTADRVNELQNLMNDVTKESAAASKRVVDLLMTLYALKQRLREESVRHYLALSGIARNEVERWDDLGGLSEEFNRLFQQEHLFKKTNIIRMLFSPGKHCPTNINQDISVPPNVCLSDRVIFSIRRLAATANYYQSNTPQKKDPNGAHAFWSMERLARATGILQIYQLMTAVNHRRAAENSIELFGEVQEHTIHMDDIIVTGVETEIGYGLDKLVAFHASGITQQDIELLVSLIQSGLLVWIGAGVN